MSIAHVDRRDLLKSAAAGAAAVGLSTGAEAMTLNRAAVQSIGSGRGRDFDLGWRFLRGEGSGFEAPGLDDSGWRRPGVPSFAGWPAANAFCGDIDLIGAQKPPSLARDVAWGLSTLEVTVQRPAPEGKRDEPQMWGWHDELDSWTWPDMGRPMTVRLYTSAERLELQLNGKTVGTHQRKGEPGMVEFTVPYAPGVLEAVAWRGARVVARKRLETAGAPVGLRLRAEKPGGAGRGDVSFVMIEVVDATGRRVPDAEIELAAQVKGAGELVAFGNAKPIAQGSFQSGRAKTWHGRALAIVRGTGVAGRAGLSINGDRRGAGDDHAQAGLS